MEKHYYSTISRQLHFNPNPLNLVLHLFVDIILFIAITFLLDSSLALISIILIPVLLFRSFALMHECVHSSAISNRWLNDFVGIIAGAFCLLPYEPWKKIHLEHHKWTGNVDRDPSMGLIKQFPNFGQRKLRFLNFCWKHWIPAMATSQHLVFWLKSYQYVLKTNSKAGIFKNAFSVALPISLYCFIPWPEIFPGLLVYLLLVEVINLPHHLQMPMISGNDSIPVYQQDRLARSCIYPRWFSRHILNNFNLHIEHHLFPRLPWYRLEEARFMICQLNSQSYRKVAGNHWILENRKRSVNLVFAKNFNQTHEEVLQKEIA